MATYQDKAGNQIVVANPDLNPDLISGKTLVSDANYATPDSINSSTLASSPTVTLPTAPQPTVPDITGGQAIVDANAKTLAPAATDPNATPDWLTQFLQTQTPPPSGADLYNQDYASAGVDQKQQNANAAALAEQDARGRSDALNAQLQGFAAEATAIPIRDQQNAKGRGVTVGGLAPITNAQLRTNALRALPVQAAALVAQADLANAQGKTALAQSILNQAQDHVDKLFAIHQTDANNQYQYRQNLINKVYDIATTKEKERLDAQRADLTRKQNLEDDARKYAQSLATVALNSGQGTLASKFASLDPASPTYNSDLQKYMTQIITTGSGIAAPTVKTINGVDMQWNPKSGQWENIAGQPAPQVAQKTIDQLALLKQAMTSAETHVGKSGAGLIGRTISGLLGGSEFNQLVADTNTLKTNVLTLMTDPGIKKFFGPQMSNADVQLMTSAGTTLNPELQSPTQMKTELARLKDLFTRMETAVNGGVQQEQTGGTIITAPDGSQIRITD